MTNEVFNEEYMQILTKVMEAIDPLTSKQKVILAVMLKNGVDMAYAIEIQESDTVSGTSILSNFDPNGEAH